MKRMIYALMVLTLSMSNLHGMDIRTETMTDAQYKALQDKIMAEIPDILKKTGKYPNVSYELIVSYLRHVSGEKAALDFSALYHKIIGAIEREKEDKVKLLLTQGGDRIINIYYNNKGTFLQQAIQKNDYTIANLLIKSGANANALSESGETALMVAVDYVDSENVTSVDGLKLITLLIENADDVNRVNINNETALMMASTRGDWFTVAKLLKKGASVYLVNVDGNTALSLTMNEGLKGVEKHGGALPYNHAQVTRLLLDYGADPMILNKDKTLLDIGGQPFIDFMRKYLYEKVMQEMNLIERTLAPSLKDIPGAGSVDLASLVAEYAADTSKTLNNKELWERLYPATVKIVSAVTGKSQINATIILSQIQGELNVQSAKNRKIIIAIFNEFNALLEQYQKDNNEKTLGAAREMATRKQMLFNHVPTLQAMMYEVVGS